MKSRRARMSVFFAVVVAALALVSADDDVAELQPDWTPPDVPVNLQEVREEMDDLEKLEVLKKLKEMLGIRGDLREESPRAVPPEFMVELYNTVADSEGKILGRNPYDAKVVRSFLEIDSTSSHFYMFNVSSLEPNESVLEAEFHLHRKRSSPQSMHPSVLSSPYYLISVYQVLPDKSLEEPDLHRLLNVHYVGAYASGWQVFNVKQAVLSWLSGAPNLGLLVTATTIFGDQVTVGFSRRDEQPRDKQPILVLFNDDGSGVNDIVRLPVQPARDSPHGSEAGEYEGSADEELNAETMPEDDQAAGTERSRAKRRAGESWEGEGQPELPDYVDGGRPVFFPREKKDRARKDDVVEIILREDVEKPERERTRNKRQASAAKKGQPELPDYVDLRRPVVFEREKKLPVREGIDENGIGRPRNSQGFVRRKNPEQVLTSMDIYQRALLREKLQSRRAPERPSRQSRRVERSADPVPGDDRAKRDSECRKVEAEPCARRELFVNFQEIGMTSIIAPEGYQAYQCRGHCKSPLSQDQKPTNHATIQGIINKMKLTPSQEVDMPCCVPAKLSSISILYLDDDSAVVLKSYTDMVVNSCGCR